MNVLSLFDGISCGQIALKRAGISINNYFASEIDSHAIKITQINYPNTIQLGEICGVNVNRLPKINLLIGGSPCQGFSFAGRGLNFQDIRSKLFFEFIRVLNECKPDYFLLENVPMKKEYEQVITDALGVSPILINSKLVSAQNRKRLYWTNIPNVTLPSDKKITWNDVKEKDPDIRDCFFYTNASIKWLNTYSNGVTHLPELSHLEKRRLCKLNFPDCKQAVAGMRGRYIVDGKRRDGRQHTKGLTRQYIEFRHDGKTNALTTVAKDNVVVPFTLRERIPVDEFFFRHLTPTECERLQTIPEGYTSSVAKTHRLKTLGNGWTVDVIAHILREVS